MTKKTNTKQCNTTRQYKGFPFEQGMISEVEWQQWQDSYAAMRRKIFLKILGTGEKDHQQ